MLDSASIILTNSGLIALRTLLAVRRALDPKYSYSYISTRLGIKARSYLPEVFKEKKPLNPKHIVPLVDFLELPIAEAEILRAKLLLEFGQLSAAEREQIRLSLRDSEKKMASGDVELSQVRDINLALIIAASLHLFVDGKANRRQILELFGRERYLEVERGLSDLIQSGLFAKDGDILAYSPEFSNILHLYTSTSKKASSDYLRASLREAHDKVSVFEDRSQEMVFYSGIITTEMAKYLEALEQVKHALRNMQSRIECHPADTLVRFNVQLYPIVHKES